MSRTLVRDPSSPAWGPWSGRLIEAGALVLLVFTPLAYGTVEPWSEAIAELVVLAMALVWILAMVRDWEVRMTLPPGWLPGTLFLALVFIQTTPLPPTWIIGVSPFTAALTDHTHQFTQSSMGPIPLSLDPHQTWREGLKLAAVALFCLVLYNTIYRRSQVQRLIWTMILMGTVISIFGIIQRATWNGRLFWIGPEAPHQQAIGPQAFGPFVNRAHFAGLVTIVVTLGLALMLARAEVPASRPGRVDFRSRVRRWMGRETGAGRLLPFLILVMGGAILIAGSRGGILGLLSALVCVGVFSRLRRQPDHRGPALMGIGVAVGLTGLWMGSEIFLDTIGRLTAEISVPESSLRILRWRDVADLVARAPLFGTGLASFEMAFPVVRTIAYPTRFTHAESDWVQLFADTGLVGVGLVIAMVGAIFAEGFRCIRRAESAQRRALCVGGLAVLAASVLQSVPNYTIPMMANHLYLATAIALTIRREL